MKTVEKREYYDHPVKSLYLKANLTQEQLADEFGVSPRTVSRWITQRYKEEPKLKLKQVRKLDELLTTKS